MFFFILDLEMFYFVEQPLEKSHIDIKQNFRLIFEFSCWWINLINLVFDSLLKALLLEQVHNLYSIKITSFFVTFKK